MTAGGAPGAPAAGVAAGPRRRDDVHLVRVGADVDEDVRKALAFVLRSTQARPQTEGEIRAKLRARGFDDDVVDATIGQARSLKAVDDAALARALVEERGLRRGHGATRVRDELAGRQVPDDVAEDALRLLEDRDEEAVVRDLAERRLARLPTGLAPEAATRRLVAYLVRRGHPPGLAQRVALSVAGADRGWD